MAYPGSNHSSTTGYWSNSTNNTWPVTVAIYVSPETTCSWRDAWLDRYVRACRARRREAHLEAVRSTLAPAAAVGMRPRGLPKILLWLSRVVRKGA